MLNDAEKKLVLNSWRLVVPIKDTAADLFYRRLFELKPSYQQLFKSDDAKEGIAAYVAGGSVEPHGMVTR